MPVFMRMLNSKGVPKADPRPQNFKEKPALTIVENVTLFKDNFIRSGGF